MHVENRQDYFHQPSIVVQMFDYLEWLLINVAKEKRMKTMKTFSYSTYSIT